MKRGLLFIAALSGFSARSQAYSAAQNLLYPSVTAYSAHKKDAFCFLSNSASLAGVKGFSAGVFSERKFLLKELSSHSLAVVLPTTSGNFGFSGSYSGGGAYNEASLGLAYGRHLEQSIGVGVQFCYYSATAAGYGKASSLAFSAGTLIFLTENIQTGVSVFHPVDLKRGKAYGEKLPAVYSAGIGFDASPQFHIGVGLLKAESQPATVNAGLHYEFAKGLFARGGISTATSACFLGFGVQLKSIRVDVSASVHPFLGTSPGLLLLYSTPK